MWAVHRQTDWQTKRDSQTDRVKWVNECNCILHIYRVSVGRSFRWTTADTTTTSIVSLPAEAKQLYTQFKYKAQLGPKRICSKLQPLILHWTYNFLPQNYSRVSRCRRAISFIRNNDVVYLLLQIAVCTIENKRSALLLSWSVITRQKSINIKRLLVTL